MDRVFVSSKIPVKALTPNMMVLGDGPSEGNQVQIKS